MYIILFNCAESMSMKLKKRDYFVIKTQKVNIIVSFK